MDQLASDDITGHAFAVGSSIWRRGISGCDTGRAFCGPDAAYFLQQENFKFTSRFVEKFLLPACCCSGRGSACSRNRF